MHPGCPLRLGIYESARCQAAWHFIWQLRAVVSPRTPWSGDMDGRSCFACVLLVIAIAALFPAYSYGTPLIHWILRSFFANNSTTKAWEAVSTWLQEKLQHYCAMVYPSCLYARVIFGVRLRKRERPQISSPRLYFSSVRLPASI